MLRVLTYHRIANPSETPDLYPGLISASTRGFDQQLQYLKENYSVIGMEEVLLCLRKKKRVDPRAVLLTFDDAYRDFLENAWPALSRYHLPVTLFVPTAYPDHPENSFWWDRLFRAVNLPKNGKRSPLDAWPRSTEEERRVTLRKLQSRVKELPYPEAMAMIEGLTHHLNEATLGSVLTWDELRKLAAQGVTLAPHTRTHPILTQMSEDEAWEEIRGSYDDLEQKIGPTLPVFCYPNGDYNNTVRALVKRSGLEAAFSTIAGQNYLPSADPFSLRRINVSPRTPPALFGLRISRWVSPLDRWRQSRRKASAARRKPESKDLPGQTHVTPQEVRHPFPHKINH